MSAPSLWITVASLLPVTTLRVDLIVAVAVDMKEMDLLVLVHHSQSNFILFSAISLYTTHKLNYTYMLVTLLHQLHAVKCPSILYRYVYHGTD